MSRQNLTQRLGRDNFQEQDMRMIAEILGCSFQLSILATAEAAERASVIEEIPPTSRELNKLAAKKEMKAARAEAKGEAERDLTVGEFVDMMASAGGPEETFVPEEMWGAEAAEPKEDQSLKDTETSGKPESKGQIEDSKDSEHDDLTMDEDKSAAENQKTEAAGEKENSETEQPEVTADVSEEVSEAGQNEEEQSSGEDSGESKVTQDIPQAEIAAKSTSEAVSEEIPQEKEEVREPEKKEEKSSKFARITRIISTPKKREQPKDFQPIKKRADEDEDLVNGDVNPYTGHEYQTNSVRMHPKRIGYVQVYDRKEHKWTDMTEWAFLGYEERKKATQGKDYEPPIYLD